MKKKRKGEGRGLEPYEVAIIKRMWVNQYPRDEIMSFIIRPGRKISPAAVSEVMNGKIGLEVEAATVEEAERFIRRRLNESRPLSTQDLGGPTTPSVVRELLRVGRNVQQSLPGFESNTFEYKRDLPPNKAEICKIAKTIASFANAQAGYIFFGIEDNRNVIGISNPERTAKSWNDISEILVSRFTPTIIWNPDVVEVSGTTIGLIYVQESRYKPIISVMDGPDITKGTIYYRYGGISKPIEPGDLLNLLSERDRIVIASQAQAPPSATDFSV